MKDRRKIFAQNKARLDKILGPYNQLTGEGSLINRVEFRLHKRDGVIYIPATMLLVPWINDAVNAGSLYNFYKQKCEQNNLPLIKQEFNDLVFLFNDIRLDHDFEYWAIICWHITDKDTGLKVPFRLNYPQRVALVKIEKERLLEKPIRIIIVKMRQWGGSTLIQAYFAWIQNRLKTGWGSVIITHVENQARNIRAMTTNAAKLYPKEYGSLTLKPFEGSTKTKIIVERDCVVDITSVEKPESTRSFDYALCHLSEVGLWRATLLKKPEDMVQNIRSGVKKVPLSMIVLESTAKGVGNFFHREWQKAKSGENGYVPVFMPWFKFEKYMLPIKDYDAFLDQMTDRDWARWLQGATLEGINWYNQHKKLEGYDDWRMESEFPGDDTEAFQSTDEKVFHIRYIEELALGCVNPETKGRLHADADTGRAALKNIEFESQLGGNLWLWAEPDRSIKVKNRYLVTVDVGGTTENADYSIIRVLDRYWLIDGGVPEFVATWRGHIDQDLLAWLAVQIAEWYDHALLAVENNSLVKDKENTEGDHYLTILNEISDDYDNLYATKKIEQIREGVPVKWGFHTNKSTKPMIISTLKAAMRDGRFRETDIRIITELKSYERKPDGTLGAVDGQHDDILMATAIGVWISENDMDAPVVVVPKVKQRYSRGVVKNESNF